MVMPYTCAELVLRTLPPPQRHFLSPGLVNAPLRRRLSESLSFRVHTTLTPKCAVTKIQLLDLPALLTGS